MYAREIKISSDGTRFVYFMNDRPAKSFVLGILDIQSGKELELWRVSGVDYPGGISPDPWAPDGKHVLVVRKFKSRVTNFGGSLQREAPQKNSIFSRSRLGDSLCTRVANVSHSRKAV